MAVLACIEMPRGVYSSMKGSVLTLKLNMATNGACWFRCGCIICVRLWYVWSECRRNCSGCYMSCLCAIKASFFKCSGLPCLCKLVLRDGDLSLKWCNIFRNYNVLLWLCNPVVWDGGLAWKPCNICSCMWTSVTEMSLLILYIIAAINIQEAVACVQGQIMFGTAHLLTHVKLEALVCSQH